MPWIYGTGELQKTELIAMQSEDVIKGQGQICLHWNF